MDMKALMATLLACMVMLAPRASTPGAASPNAARLNTPPPECYVRVVETPWGNWTFICCKFEEMGEVCTDGWPVDGWPL